MRKLVMLQIALAIALGAPARAQLVAARTPAAPLPSSNTRAAADETARPPSDATRALERILDTVVLRESELLQQVRLRRPLVETYIQTLAPDAVLGTVPTGDEYFLGKLDISEGVNSRSLVPAPGIGKKIGRIFTGLFSGSFLPNGFASMFFVDDVSFDRRHYSFEFVRREFLGEVRTLVFEVMPAERGTTGFMGRIWVEDQDYNIVRFNGTYGPSTFLNKYFHFDSWRVQMGPGMWLPAIVYSEESDFKVPLKKRLRYRAQTRIWGYEPSGAQGIDEFTKVMVESADSADLSATADDFSPVGSVRAWERLAEDNVLERMTKAGLLAPEGAVDRVLDTVVNNLVVTNGLDIQPDVRCRVLLTTPLESFSIGRTIVLSRGLIDVLPDEGSLAMVLAHELGHIVLGHALDTRFAFSDRLLFDDEDALEHLGFRRTEAEEEEADTRAIELLRNSPYADKLASATLFLEALRGRSGTLRALIRPHLGDRLAEQRRLARLEGIVGAAPRLEPSRTDQIAALPLGGRVKVDPWSATIELLRNKPLALLTAREKLPFEVTPLLPYLTRRPGERASGDSGSTPPGSLAPGLDASEAALRAAPPDPSVARSTSASEALGRQEP